jgi:ribosomal protein S12 methylthiotransferase
VRTNLIIGFPWETKQDFEQLKTFVQAQNFDNIALFEYHDEPFATSSKLDKKVDDKEIRRRFLEMKKIVDKQLIANEKKRKWEQEVWYIMEVKKLKNWKIEKLTIRSRLHAPEIDSYDEISREQVLATFDSADEANIGDRIVYIV